MYRWKVSLFQAKVSFFFENLNPDPTHEPSNQELFQNFEKHIVELATEVADCEVTSHPDWFSES